MYYFPTKSRASARRSALDKLVQVFFGGVPPRDSDALLHQEDWTDEELQSLQAQIEQVRKEPGRSKRAMTTIPEAILALSRSPELSILLKRCSADARACCTVRMAAAFQGSGAAPHTCRYVRLLWPRFRWWLRLRQESESISPSHLRSGRRPSRRRRPPRH